MQKSRCVVFLTSDCISALPVLSVIQNFVSNGVSGKSYNLATERLAILTFAKKQGFPKDSVFWRQSQFNSFSRKLISHYQEVKETS